jgi:2-dehydropantoate 2-reductase
MKWSVAEMRILVVGAGAMGSLFGARLAAAGHDVLLYDIWQEHVGTIRRNGLIIEEVDGTPINYQVSATDQLPQAVIPAAELVLLEVKTYDTMDALRPLRPHLREATYVLSLQNGVGNLEQMKLALPEHERLLIGTTAHGSNVVGPGRVRHTGAGPTEIGDPRTALRVPFNLAPIAEAFTRAGIVTSVAPNVHAAVWLKLAANATINPLTALTGLRNGELLHDGYMLGLAEQIVLEQLAVMDAMEIPRVKDDYFAHARMVMDVTAQSYSSMLQDVRFRRRTEIEAINGALGRFGDAADVPVPVNHWVAALVRNRQRDYLDIGRGAFA